jgi:two-component system, cell cycle sensor histidine kinase and response regulator CckA
MPAEGDDHTPDSRAALAARVRELEALIERQDRLLRELHVGVIVQGPNAEVFFANQKSLDLLGLTSEEFYGVTSFDPRWDIVHEDGTPFPACDRPVARVLETRQPVHGVVMGVDRPRHGDRVWLLVNAEPTLATDGSVAEVVVTQHDLTEHRRLEQALALSRRLEAVGRLAGGIAHDFNNLLAVVTTSTALALRRRLGDARLSEDLAPVMQATEAAKNLIAQLLAFARQQPSAPRVVELNQHLERVRPLLLHLVGRQVTLRTQPGEQPASVRVDPTQFDQVLWNLATNARDAMPGGGTLRIEIEHETGGAGTPAAAGAWVVLHVADSGEGMPEDVAERVFEPFFTTKAPGQGTGLGLATVHGIVAQAGGFVKVKSRVGEGTTFSVWFPRVRSPLTAPPPND